MENTYLVFAVHQWNYDLFNRLHNSLPGNYYFFRDKNDLSLDLLIKYNPRYIFFPHWSWKVPKEILEAAECVCFHMTDVPYGRGGSPLQNLIVRGHKNTQITALRMVEEMDAGPIYMKHPLDLSGRAEEIYQRASQIIFEMIGEIIKTEPTPIPQTGEGTFFPRRKPEESKLPEKAELEFIYDYIRMLDAPGYPHAFIEYGNFRLEFDQAENKGDEITARVRIKKNV